MKVNHLTTITNKFVNKVGKYKAWHKGVRIIPPSTRGHELVPRSRDSVQLMQTKKSLYQ